MNDSEKKFYMSLGSALKEMREKKHLSAYDVAEKLGKSHQTIYYWEIGQRKIYADDLSAYTKLLGTTMSEVLKHIDD